MVFLQSVFRGVRAIFVRERLTYVEQRSIDDLRDQLIGFLQMNGVRSEFVDHYAEELFHNIVGYEPKVLTDRQFTARGANNSNEYMRGASNAVLSVAAYLKENPKLRH